MTKTNIIQRQLAWVEWNVIIDENNDLDYSDRPRILNVMESKFFEVEGGKSKLIGTTEEEVSKYLGL